MVSGDDYNQTDGSIGFTDSKFGVWGRRFFTTGDAAAADASNVAFYPAAGYRGGYDGHVNNVGWGAMPGRPRRTLPRRRTEAF
ncbi:MAG: hypothetical protein LUE99_19430 [Bacteroides sp.]|nr:hypothetical protein [Bacteroides sp.]